MFYPSGQQSAFWAYPETGLVIAVIGDTSCMEPDLAKVASYHIAHHLRIITNAKCNVSVSWRLLIRLPTLFPFLSFRVVDNSCPCPVILLEFKTSLSEFLIVSSASLFATVFATVILSLHSSCADWLRVSISGFVLSYEKFAKWVWHWLDIRAGGFIRCVNSGLTSSLPRRYISFYVPLSSFSS